MRALLLVTLLGLAASAPLTAQRSVRVRWSLVDIVIRGDRVRPLMFIVGPNPQGKVDPSFRMTWTLFDPAEAVAWAATIRRNLETLPASGNLGQQLGPALWSIQGDRFLALSVAPAGAPKGERLALVNADSAQKTGLSATATPRHVQELIDGFEALATWTLRPDSATPPGAEGPICPAEAEYLHQLPLDIAPERVSGPPPQFPVLELKARRSGSVWVQILIDTLGRPDPATMCAILTEGTGFTQSALEVARGSRFKPGIRGGRPVAALVLLPVTYTSRPF